MHKSICTNMGELLFGNGSDTPHYEPHRNFITGSDGVSLRNLILKCKMFNLNLFIIEYTRALVAMSLKCHSKSDVILYGRLTTVMIWSMSWTIWPFYFAIWADLGRLLASQLWWELSHLLSNYIYTYIPKQVSRFTSTYSFLNVTFIIKHHIFGQKMLPYLTF